MKMRCGLVAVLLLGRVSQAQAPWHVDVRMSASANLAYQLDCVSGVVAACGRDDYTALWEREFLSTAADRSALDAWGAMRRRYEAQFQVPGAGAGDSLAVDVGNKLRLATLQATSLADLLLRLEVVLALDDWLVARDVLRHFEPRFGDWWGREAEPRSQPFIAALRRLLARDDITALIGTIARFYATPYPADAGVPLQLFYRPALVVTSTSGQQVERWAVVEFLHDEPPEDRLDVVVHELCHFFMLTRTVAQRRQLDARLVATRSPARSAARNLLDEGLATALGNGWMAARLAGAAQPDTSRSWYNNPNIDRAGKVLATLLGPRLQGGGTLDDADFAAAWVRALHEGMGEGVTAPTLLLNELYLFTDEALGDEVRREVRRLVRPASMYAEQAPPAQAVLQELRRNPGLNALFIVRPSALPALRRRGMLVGGEQPLAGTKGLLVGRTASGAYRFLVLANGPAEATALLQQLVRLGRV